MTGSRLYVRAGQAYEEAGLPLDALRCYRAAGAHRQAADLLVGMGDHEGAVGEYEQAGVLEIAGWIAVHHLASPAKARGMVAHLEAAAEQDPLGDGHVSPFTLPHRPAPRRDDSPSSLRALTLRYRLVVARCDLAEGGSTRAILPLLAEVSAVLSEPEAAYDRFAEEWAVAVAECAGRHDQVALLFAASVRGYRLGAAQRWQEWARRVQGTELSIPSTHALGTLGSVLEGVPLSAQGRFQRPEHSG
ncbi:hypothetical protein [Streptomyces spongiae]|uniref:Tetratricopeptide repeat protein n=1 Tax=Streptomyces spongiae TaxID=565072 RepID=A0A5N8XG25_9ACTN|nr:hypothetical protein [Streptomyces spongiae]MPY58421.1 hypothetical protein [Streptomyces spongiae]